MTVKDIGRRFITRGPVEAVCLPREQIAELCSHPYHSHPKGCPNYGKKLGCPGKMNDYFPEIFEPEVKIAALEFDFGDYLKMMAEKHPTWTEAQLRCPLYWQGHLRKDMGAVLFGIPRGYTGVLLTPEAFGVDVTATCKEAEIELEWPPQEHSYMVALFVKKKALEQC